MDELHRHKRRIFAYSAALLVLGLVSIFLIIGAAESFKGQWFVLALIVLFFIQMPLIISVSRTAIRIITSLINAESSKNSSAALKSEEDLDKEVEEKVKEADDLSFNLAMLKDSIGEVANWEDFGNGILINISKQLNIVVGIVYAYSSEVGKFSSRASYAYYSENPIAEFSVGEGIAGQVIKDNRAMFLSEIPDGYIKIVSGLGDIEPKYLALFPIVKNDKVIGLLEVGSFKALGKGVERRAKEISEFLGAIAPEL